MASSASSAGSACRSSTRGASRAMLRRTTGLYVVVRNGGRLLATNLPGADDVKLPIEGEAGVGGKDYSVRAFTAPADFPGQKITVHTLGVPLVRADDVRAGRIFIGSILLGFLLLALVCAVLVSRSLQQQLQGFLDAARRLAGGDFSAKVTTVGRDEFAGLGEEFNKMSRRARTAARRAAPGARAGAGLDAAARRGGRVEARPRCPAGDRRPHRRRRRRRRRRPRLRHRPRPGVAGGARAERAT